MIESRSIRCVIVDDEPLAVNLLADYVQRTPGLVCSLATTQVMDALAVIEQGQTDLLLLDIQMPELTGIQFMKIVRNKCNIILASAYPQYAIDGYENDVVDYLLKPVTYDRFVIAIAKFKNKLQPTPVLPAKPQNDHIFLKTSNRLQRIDLSSVDYIEGLRDYVAIHTKTGKILSLEKMKHLLELLPSENFVRIHKSYIVNKTKITFIEKGAVIINKISLPIGDTYREEFMNGLRSP